jgi:hypothetical protein
MDVFTATVSTEASSLADPCHATARRRDQAAVLPDRGFTIELVDPDEIDTSVAGDLH